MNEIDQIPTLVGRLYEIVDELEERFPGRRFTPDGHLVGSLGEVLAAAHYDLELLPGSTEGHDAVSAFGKRVEIKATQGRSVGLRSEPEHLLVLRLTRRGQAVEAFNGPGHLAWRAAGKMQKNGQRSVSLSTLERLMRSVSEAARLPRRPR